MIAIDASMPKGCLAKFEKKYKHFDREIYSAQIEVVIINKKERMHCEPRH